MRRKGGRYIVAKEGGPAKREEFTKPRPQSGEAAADKKQKPPPGTAKSKGETGVDK